jgi:hypothetical protein
MGWITPNGALAPAMAKTGGICGIRVKHLLDVQVNGLTLSK